MTKSARKLLIKTFSKWNEHEAPRLGAALAFYSILSLPPLLILIVSIVGAVLGRSAAESKLVDQIQGLMGDDGAKAVRSLLESSRRPSQGGIASVIAFVTLFLGASGVLGELRAALNKVWEAPARPNAGFAGMLRERFFSLAMVLAVGFLLLVSLVTSAGLAMATGYFNQILPLPAPVAVILNLFISLIAIAAAFALLFRYVPEVKTPWIDLWAGALFTSFLFSVGKSLIGIYLGRAAVASAYGAAGSLIAGIVWIYYSAQIVFFGAEFTHVLSEDQSGPPKGE